MRKYTDVQLHHMSSFSTLAKAGAHYGISRQAVQALLQKHLGIRRHDDVGLMTTAEVASLIGKAEPTLRAWRRKGKGPEFVCLSGAVTRYRPADILAWLLQEGGKLGKLGQRLKREGWRG